MKTLVVDDEIISRRKMERIMQSFGECVAVESGEEALVAFAQAWESWSPFELVTLDFSMPGMNGDEVLRRIRQAEEAKGVAGARRIRALMVTARSDKATVIECVQAGCNDYLTKPFDEEVVAKKLRRLWSAVVV